MSCFIKICQRVLELFHAYGRNKNTSHWKEYRAMAEHEDKLNKWRNENNRRMVNAGSDYVKWYGNNQSPEQEPHVLRGMQHQFLQSRTQTPAVSYTPEAHNIRIRSAINSLPGQYRSTHSQLCVSNQTLNSEPKKYESYWKRPTGSKIHFHSISHSARKDARWGALVKTRTLSYIIYIWYKILYNININLRISNSWGPLRARTTG